MVFVVFHSGPALQGGVGVVFKWKGKESLVGFAMITNRELRCGEVRGGIGKWEESK